MTHSSLSSSTAVFVSVWLLGLVCVLVPTDADTQTDNKNGSQNSTLLGQADFTACSSDLIDPTFTEPVSCPHEGQQFRLCVPGQHKISQCIPKDDKIEYCEFCTPGETFMPDNNNCTSCMPCTQCRDVEQIAEACTIYQDTVCEPRIPTTVPGLSCPPCPVVDPTSLGESSPVISTLSISTQTTGQFTTAPTTPPFECPTCNCTKVLPPFHQQKCTDPVLPIALGVLFAVCIVIIIVLLFCVVRKTRENKKLKVKLKKYENTERITFGNCVERNPAAETPDAVTVEVNGPNTYVEEPVPTTPTETDERVTRQANGHHSSDYESIHNSMQPTSSGDHGGNVEKIAPISEEEEEAEKAEAAANLGDPPYARTDFDRKTQSVKERVDRTEDGPRTLSSLDGRPPLPLRNNLQRSKTVGSSPRGEGYGSSFETKVDIHSTSDGISHMPSSHNHPGRNVNPAFMPSVSSETLPSKTKLGRLNSTNGADTNGVNDPEEEPTEVDPMLSPSSPGSVRTFEEDSHNKSISPLLANKKKERGRFWKRKKSKSDEQESKPKTEISSSGSQVGSSEPNIQTQTRVGEASKGTDNFEHLYAKVDKSKKRKPSDDSEATNDKKGPKGLHLDIKLPQDTSSKSTSSEGVSSLSSPLLETPEQLSSHKPDVGSSPTSDVPGEGPENLQTVNNNVYNPAIPKSNPDASVPSTLVSANAPSKDHKSSTANSVGNEGSKRRSLSREKSIGQDGVKLKDKAEASKKLPKDAIATDLDFDMVARNMSPGDLPGLYRHLGIGKAKIEQAEHDCRSTLIVEKTIAVLQAWKKEKGKKATQKAIIKGLKKSGNGEMADYFEEIFKKSVEDDDDMQESCV